MLPKKTDNHRKRIKKRFIKAEKSAHSEEALIELLLTYSIPRKDVQPLAKALLTKFGGIKGLLNASLEDLQTIKGIGQNSAILIKLVDAINFHIAIKAASEKPEDLKKVKHQQRSLFEPYGIDEKNGKVSIPVQKTIKPFRKRGVELFANALMKETISVLPDLPDTDSINTARQAIQDNLHFSAESTRKRNSLYIVRRMFPDGFVDRSMKLFANKFRGRDELREVCFYRFQGFEPLLGKVLNELLIPNIGVGYINRERIKDFLENIFPESKSIKHGTKAIIDSLVYGNLAKLNDKKIVFSYRNISFASFAFIFFSEFPVPGMYELNQIENNSQIIHMLWKPAQILPMTYELRNKGFIIKISEIDSFRQFTTKLNLEHAVKRLIS